MKHDECFILSFTSVLFPLYRESGWHLWAALACERSTAKNLDFREAVHISNLKALLSLRYKGKLHFIV